MDIPDDRILLRQAICELIESLLAKGRTDRYLEYRLPPGEHEAESLNDDKPKTWILHNKALLLFYQFVVRFSACLSQYLLTQIEQVPCDRIAQSMWVVANKYCLNMFE